MAHAPSKSEIKEEQNRWAIGGLRRPKASVARLSVLRQWAQQVASFFESFAEANPDVWQVTARFGDRTYEGPPPSLALKWRESLHEWSGAKAEPPHQ